MMYCFDPTWQQYITSDPHYHQLWKNICKVDDSDSSKNLFCCEDHFVDADYVNEEKRRLNPRVVPAAGSEPSSEVKMSSLFEELPFPDDAAVTENDVAF